MPTGLALLILGFGGLMALVVLGLGLYGAIQLTRPKRAEFVDTAERWGLPEPEHVSLHSPDGVALSAWWFARADVRPTVLIVHGHGSNKLTNLWLTADLFADFNVLLLDLRGHGESGGAHGSVGYIERNDVRAAVSWLVERFVHVPIGVLGISMGGAAVINAAAEDSRIAAVVADSAFAWLRGPVYEAICARGYPRRVSGVLAWSVCAVAPWLGAPLGRRWRDPLEVVHLIAPRPLLLIHGEADTYIRVEHAHALFAGAGDPKELWVLPEAGHARVAEIDPKAYVEHVRRFFREALEPTGQPAAAAGADHRDDISNGQLHEVDRSQGSHAELARDRRLA